MKAVFFSKALLNLQEILKHFLPRVNNNVLAPATSTLHSEAIKSF